MTLAQYLVQKQDSLVGAPHWGQVVGAGQTQDDHGTLLHLMSCLVFPKVPEAHRRMSAVQTDHEKQKQKERM